MAPLGNVTQAERPASAPAEGGAPALDGRPRLAEVRMPDGLPVASRDAPVGGQAVLEGVMMRGVSTWAVAVRKPDEQDRGGSRSRWCPGRSATECSAGR